MATLIELKIISKLTLNMVIKMRELWIKQLSSIFSINFKIFRVTNKLRCLVGKMTKAVRTSYIQVNTIHMYGFDDNGELG